MVNSYLATSSGLYKNYDSPTNTYQSNIAAMYISNNQDDDHVSVSIVGDSTYSNDSSLINFGTNGTVYLILDDNVWDNWAGTSTMGAGSGIELAGYHVLKVTNPYVATLDNISFGLEEKGMIGVMFEYYGNSLPDSSYYWGFSFGNYEGSPTSQVGDPTYFNTLVLNSPAIDSSGGGDYIIAGQPFVNNINFENAKIFPVPTSMELNVSFSLQSNVNDFDMEIYDFNGSKVKSFHYRDLKKGDNNKILPINSLSEGQYLLKISDGCSYKTLKFIKNN